MRLANVTSGTTIIGTVQKGGGGGGDPYTGSYIVTSDAHNDQILPTQNKLMTQNMTVKKIPYEEVSNLYGGKTAVIGE